MVRASDLRRAAVSDTTLVASVVGELPLFIKCCIRILTCLQVAVVFTHLVAGGEFDSIDLSSRSCDLKQSC